MTKHTQETREKISNSHKGKKLSEETKDKIAETHYINKRTTLISINNILYHSVSEVARLFNISRSCVRKRCKSLNFYSWSFVN